jgi:5-methylcytosine-specific restriction endonuclease McrA
MGTIHSRRWRTLRDRVLFEQPFCQLKLDGCTLRADCVDHIIPRSERPELWDVRSNLQAACTNCNLRRGTRRLGDAQPARALAFFDTAG